MGIKLGDAIVFLRGDQDPLKKDLAEGKKTTKAWTTAVGTMVGNLMGQAIAGGARLATSMVKGLATELRDLTFDAAKIEGVRNTFGRLAESVGGEGVEALQQLREATRGMVADADLWQAGNKFLAMGLAETTEGAAKLSEMATQLGMAMGEDATSSMENFALMMANQSIPRLDSFGISSSKVRERIKELMEATEGMTREAAFNQAVMEQGALTMEKVGEQAMGAAAGIARLRTFFANLKLKAGQALQPILNAIVSIGEALVEKYGPKIEEWLERLKVPMEFLGQALQLLVDGDFDGFLGALTAALTALGVPEETVNLIADVIKTLVSAFQDLKDGNIEEFIGKIKAVLLELGVPIETVDKIEKVFRKIYDWIAEIPERLDWLSNAFWIWWGMKAKPFFDTIKENLTESKDDWILFKSELGRIFQGPIDRLKKAFSGLWETLGDLFGLLGIGEGGTGEAGGYLSQFYNATVAYPVTAFIVILEKAISGLAGAVEFLNKGLVFLIEHWDELELFKLPGWLTPGSPTPFELGLRGITDAMTDLNALGTPQLQAAFSGLGGQTSITNHNYNLTAQYQDRQSPGSLADDVRALSILTAGA